MSGFIAHLVFRKTQTKDINLKKKKKTAVVGGQNIAKIKLKRSFRLNLCVKPNTDIHLQCLLYKLNLSSASRLQ